MKRQLYWHGPAQPSPHAPAALHQLPQVVAAQVEIESKR
jgi:hypothetical protein